MVLRDKWGWPVEFINGHHFDNFMRALFITNIGKTWDGIKHHHVYKREMRRLARRLDHANR